MSYDVRVTSNFSSLFAKLVWSPLKAQINKQWSWQMLLQPVGATDWEVLKLLVKEESLSAQLND